jgi:hypothetical protein
MFGLIAFVLGIIAAILAWFSKTPADTAFFYGAVAFIALEVCFPNRGLLVFGNRGRVA